jgi:hypothetical protein
MEITLNRQEVEKIILDYVNKLVEGYGFDLIKSGSYYELPDKISVKKTKEAKNEHTSLE